MKSSFHPREFQSMLFDPSKVPAGSDILKFYKELAKHKEFRLNPGEAIDNNKLMQYVFCMYDMNSPYRKKFTDVLKRKIEACHDCEFPTNANGTFAEPVEDFLKGKNEIVNKKICEFVRMHRNYKYSYQVAIESSYYSLMVSILGGDTKQIQEARKMQGELEENLMEMLNQDSNPFLKNEMLRYMEDERLQLRPEDIAKKLQAGESPIST